MSGFHDALFPPEISNGSEGGPKFNTSVVSLESGFEKRNQNWSRPRWEYEAVHAVKTEEQSKALYDFFIDRRGKAFAFRFKDWADYQLSAQAFAVADGATTSFQLRKTYGVVNPFYRDIVKPVKDSLLALIVGSAPMVGTAHFPGTHFTTDWSTGIVTFLEPPAAGQVITCFYCEFDVPVRFDTDLATLTHDTWKTMSWTSIPLVEVRK